MLIDRILDCFHPPISAELRDYCKDRLLNSTVIDCQNIHGYLFEKYYLQEKVDHFPSDFFPNVAPCFTDTWFEFSPHFNEPIIITPAGPVRKMGMLLTSCLGKDYFDVPEEEMPSISKNVKWVTGGVAWVEMIGKVHAMLPVTVRLLISPEGKILNTAWKKIESFEMSRYKEHGISEKDHIEQMTMVINCILGNPLFTLCFLHCKNVELKKIVPSEKQQQKRMKEGKHEFLTYHTLAIEPMKKILKSEGNIHSEGIKKALHICRGHFKDFSKGSGLFGKYKGLYWWEQSLRGTQPRIVLKDYKIETPKPIRLISERR